MRHFWDDFQTLYTLGDLIRSHTISNNSKWKSWLVTHWRQYSLLISITRVSNLGTSSRNLTKSRTLILDHIFAMIPCQDELSDYWSNRLSFISIMMLRLRRLSPLKFASRSRTGQWDSSQMMLIRCIARNVGYDFYGRRRSAIRNASKITCQSWLEICLLFLFSVIRLRVCIIFCN